MGANPRFKILFGNVRLRVLPFVLGGLFVRNRFGIGYMEPGIVGGSFLFNPINPDNDMRTITVAKHTVELFDSIDELPVMRFHKYNKMLLIDSGIGSDLADVDNHIERAIRFCRTKPDLAAAELDNLRQSIYFIQTDLSPKHLAFCVLVKSVDGKPCNDLSDDALQNLLKLFADAPHVELTAQIEAVKKKIDTELNMYFPGTFDDASVKEYYDQLKRRTIAMLDAIITGEDKRNEIEEITNLLITYTRPIPFQGKDSMEIAYDKQFESMCLLLSQQLHVEPKKFTVLEYYNAFDYLKKQTKQSKAK